LRSSNFLVSLLAVVRVKMKVKVKVKVKVKAAATLRSSNCLISLLAAAALFAKTSTPDVFRSSRWTGRTSLAYLKVQVQV
jgi:hypothetical protein